MVLREDRHGWVVIGQPAHSWISGQLARCWGDEAFGTFAPFEEVCLAAELHDIGFLEWDDAPALNPATGHPRDFMNMPTGPHLDLWSAGVQRVLSYNRYAGLLASLHFTGLCQHKKMDRSPQAGHAAQGFLDQQSALQTKLLASLRADPRYAAHSTDGLIARNSQLLGAWDWMSLVFCQGRPGQATVRNVPAKGEGVTLTITTAAPEAQDVTVAPWPFRSRKVELVCDGRRLTERFADESGMRRALREAPAVAVTIHLSPGAA